MSFFSELAKRFGLARKNSTLEIFREIYGGFLGGSGARSGVDVTWNSALQVATVHACVRVIADGIAQVPWLIYQKRDGITKVADDHALAPLLRSTMCARLCLTKFELLETVMLHVLLTGNAYLFVGRVGRERKIKEIFPIEPQRVSPQRTSDGAMFYRLTDFAGQSQEFTSDTIWHIRGPSWNSWLGLNATRLAREAIGLSIALEQTHAELHRNGAKMSGLYTVAGQLSTERYDKLEAWMAQFAVGGSKAGKPMILDSGADFKPTMLNGVDAQHLETRAHQISEICRHFRVMPVMVGLSERTQGYNGVEQLMIAHVTHTLMPWFHRLEQSADLNLLSQDDRDAGFTTKFNTHALLRGASRDRGEYYAKALGAGGSPAWMTPNEIREIEDLNPLASGNELNPGATLPISSAPDAGPGTESINVDN